MKAGPRAVSAAVCAACALSSVLLARGDGRLRGEAREFARRFTLDERRPDYAATARFAAAGDLAFSPLVSATLEDANSPTRIGGLPPELRRLWLESAEGLGDEIAAAREMMLRAIALRPGWPYHELMLGQVAYASGRRAGAVGARERWLAPLFAAAAGAPGDDATSDALGAALIEAWSALSESERASASGTLRRAFEDVAFFERVFPAAVPVVGPRAAWRLVPEQPRALLVAQKIALSLDLPAAVALSKRWETVERARRKADLERAEDRFRRGDLHGLRSAVRNWMSVHSYGDFGDHQGLAEVARLIEIWPEDRAGTWQADPRGVLVRFMLDGRTDLVSGRALERLAAGLAGVPDPVKAELSLLADNRYAWEKVVRSTMTLGSFEWTPFLVRLARWHLAARDAEEAALALRQLAPRAREECEALLVRRDVARARDDRGELEAVERSLEASTAPASGREAWSKSGSLPLCVDPERKDRLILRVRFESPSAAFLAYGWDGGRIGTLVVEHDTELEVLLDGLSGRRFFRITALAGPAPVLLGSTLVAAARTPSPLREAR